MRHEAIRKVHPNVVTINGDEWGKLQAWDKNGAYVAINQAAVDAEEVDLVAAHTAKEYARTRADAYPSTQDFMEAYTEKEIGSDSTKWDAYVIAYNKVRTDNPK